MLENQYHEAVTMDMDMSDRHSVGSSVYLIHTSVNFDLMSTRTSATAQSSTCDGRSNALVSATRRVRLF